MTIRTRFAPSPTGFMHVGNLRTCLYAYYFARHNEGQFILRIEDTDQERLVSGATEVIYHTLAQAGIIHDEGPDKDGGCGPYIQSERKPIYMDFAKELVAKGGAYYCFCDKTRLDTLADDNGIKKYDKHCIKLSKSQVEKNLAMGLPYVIRQNMPLEGISSYDDMVFGHIAVPCADMEDGILIKSDGLPTYNFANVVDDHLMSITHVIRGVEYLSSTPKYNMLYDSFGWERPHYMHLPTIMKDATRKLSKRHGDANCEDFATKGYLMSALINYISLLGWSPADNREKMSMAELISAFDPSGVSKSNSIFDDAKLRWLNSEYIKELTPQEFIEQASSFLDNSKIAGKFDYTKIAKLLIPRIEIFSDINSKTEFLTQFDGYDLSLFDNKKNKTDAIVAHSLLAQLIPSLTKLRVWNEDSLQDAIAQLVEKLDIKKAQIYYVMRVALTGALVTPGGATEMADLLGKTEGLRRLNISLSRLSALNG